MSSGKKTWWEMLILLLAVWGVLAVVFGAGPLKSVIPASWQDFFGIRQHDQNETNKNADLLDRIDQKNGDQFGPREETK